MAGDDDTARLLGRAIRDRGTTLAVVSHARLERGKDLGLCSKEP